MDYTDLIRRLRSSFVVDETGASVPIGTQAADAIETLLAENERLSWKLGVAEGMIESLAKERDAALKARKLADYEIEACLPSGTWRHSSLVGADEILRFAYAIEARVRGERQ